MCLRGGIPLRPTQYVRTGGPWSDMIHSEIVSGWTAERNRNRQASRSGSRPAVGPRVCVELKGNDIRWAHDNPSEDDDRDKSDSTASDSKIGAVHRFPCWSKIKSAARRSDRRGSFSAGETLIIQRRGGPRRGPVASTPRRACRRSMFARTGHPQLSRIETARRAENDYWFRTTDHLATTHWGVWGVWTWRAGRRRGKFEKAKQARGRGSGGGRLHDSAMDPTSTVIWPGGRVRRSGWEVGHSADRFGDGKLNASPLTGKNSRWPIPANHLQTDQIGITACCGPCSSPGATGAVRHRLLHSESWEPPVWARHVRRAGCITHFPGA